MPGLVAAAGATGAAEIVRRGAAPLLRRPWHTLSLVSDPLHGAALGFAGETGGVAREPATGVLAVVDGEVLTGGRMLSGAVAAAALVDLYLHRPGDLDALDGWFAAALWDPRSRALSLLTDRLGHRPLYLARHRGALLAAGELKALLAAGVEPELDVQACAQVLAYEAPIGERTLLAGVRAVAPGVALSVDLAGAERVHERWRYRLEPARAGDDRELVEELSRLLEQAVRRRLGPRTALALSGGLDSRCLAAVVRDLSPGTLAATYGAPESEDLEIGTHVARAARLRHRPLPLERGYIARGAAETVWLAEGQVRCFHAHHLALRALRSEEQQRALLIGFAGDPVLRMPHLPRAHGEQAFAAAFHEARSCVLPDDVVADVLTSRFAAEIRGLARESLAEELAREDGDQLARALQYLFRHTHTRKNLPGSLLFADDLLARDPLDDADLVEFCRRMPLALRRGGALERSYLRRFPELAAFPSPKDGISPSLTGARLRGGRARVALARRARTVAERTLGPARWPSRAGLGDYATDLREQGAELLGILLEPRTLARGQLAEGAVRQLVAETLSGRARHTRILGVLLTLELFQRQFVEGDAPWQPPARPVSAPAAEPVGALLARAGGVA